MVLQEVAEEPAKSDPDVTAEVLSITAELSGSDESPQPSLADAQHARSGPALRVRNRKWTRSVGDLPRGERWKRRLPEVCR